MKIKKFLTYHKYLKYHKMMIFQEKCLHRILLVEYVKKSYVI